MAASLPPHTSLAPRRLRQSNVSSAAIPTNESMDLDPRDRLGAIVNLLPLWVVGLCGQIKIRQAPVAVAIESGGRSGLSQDVFDGAVTRQFKDMMTRPERIEPQALCTLMM